MGDDAMLKVPAHYADDFRTALVEELAFDIDGVRRQRKELDDRVSWRHKNTEIVADDLRNSLAQLAEDADLAGEVGLQLTGAIEFNVRPDTGLAHIFETMVGKVLGPRLVEALNTSPIDDDWAEGTLRPLIAELTWAIDQAVNFHLRYWEAKEMAAADGTRPS